MSNKPSTKTVRLRILNNHGDEKLDLLVDDAMSTIKDQLGSGMWLFDKDNNMLTDEASIEAALAQDDQEILATPASVGG